MARRTRHEPRYHARGLETGQHAGNGEAFYFLQYSAGLSLQSFFKKRRKTAFNLEDVRLRAASGPDPVTAFLPGPKPSRMDVDVAIVKAWSIGALEFVEGQGIVLNWDGNSELLAEDMKSAARRLYRSYPTLVKVGWRFAQHVARDPKTIIEKVASLGSGGADISARELLQDIHVDAIKQVLAEAIELDRYFMIPVEFETQG